MSMCLSWLDRCVLSVDNVKVICFTWTGKTPCQAWNIPWSHSLKKSFVLCPRFLGQKLPKLRLLSRWIEPIFPYNPYSCKNGRFLVLFRWFFEKIRSLHMKHAVNSRTMSLTLQTGTCRAVWFVYRWWPLNMYNDVWRFVCFDWVICKQERAIGMIDYFRGLIVLKCYNLKGSVGV